MTRYDRLSIFDLRLLTISDAHFPLSSFSLQPLYDNDAGSATNLLSYVLEMKSNFSNAGLSDIPISISELAYGWQSTPGNITALAAALDFFMINNFPYFAFDAESGGSATSWSDFMTDITYYESISNGKPLLVTQVGHSLFHPRRGSLLTTAIHILGSF